MKGIFKKINADKIIRLGTYISFMVLLLHLSSIIIFYNFLPPFIPLFNQMPWGLERLGIKFEIFLPFIITISFTCLNLFLAIRMHWKMPLLSRILSITGLIICILSFIFIVRTIQLVI